MRSQAQAVDVMNQGPRRKHRGHATSYSKRMAWWIITGLSLLLGAAIAVAFV